MSMKVRFATWDDLFICYISSKVWNSNWLRISQRLDELAVGDWRHRFVDGGLQVRIDFKREEDRTAFALEFIE